MLAVLVGVAVFFPQQVDQELALLGMLFLEPNRKRDLARLRALSGGVESGFPIVCE